MPVSVGPLFHFLGIAAFMRAGTTSCAVGSYACWVNVVGLSCGVRCAWSGVDGE